MSDFIRLLPDSVANQIAAGEVIQRPASAVKELLENSIDAGATQIRLIIKDAGRTLIQVMDNGNGMSVTDARMCFERHATSKIREANDLFSIRTLGFRGEALASIAAIAQVELRTRKENDELGTCVVIEGSRVKSQDDVSCPKGTSIAVRNLFFNVPARRNFLKSDAVEFRHIMEEFQRVALVHQDIDFSLHHNDKLVFQLSKENLRQRIVHIFGNTINEKLLPVQVNTEHVSIHGFIGKPESAKRTRGEQYFFANGRFIKNAYLHHAVEQSYEELIPDAAIPAYFLYIDIDPSTIDVNIHPTKTEVNFEHGPLLYGTLRSAVKQALGMFSLTPVLDFDREPSLDIDPPKGYEPKQPTITVDPDFNPFRRPATPSSRPEGLKANRDQWEKLYEVAGSDQGVTQASRQDTLFPDQGSPETVPNADPSSGEAKYFQVQNRFIVAAVKSGLMIIDQQKAHERITYEKIYTALENESIAQQHRLFPLTFQLSPVDSDILSEILSELSTLGFELNELGGGVFVCNAIPANIPVNETREIIDGLLEDFKNNKSNPGSDRRSRMAKVISGRIALKAGKVLLTEEMKLLVEELFSCAVPDIAPDGRSILKILSVQEIEKLIR